MELYENTWKPTSIQHDREAHELRIINPTKDHSCPKCHHKNTHSLSIEVPFQIFWEWYNKAFNTIDYNDGTVNKFMNALTREDDIYKLLKEENRSKEDEHVKRSIEGLNDCLIRLMESMRYFESPGLLPLNKMLEILIEFIEDINITLLREYKENDIDFENWDQDKLEEVRIRRTHKVNQIILEERFLNFWTWYQTIIAVRSYREEAKEEFKALLELEDVITETTNRWVRRHLTRLITNIIYTRHDTLNREELIIQIAERFVYSKNFKLNIEDTEINKERILKLSSQENSPENNNSPEDKSPKTITPEILSPIHSEDGEPIVDEEDQNGNEDEDQDENLIINTPSELSSQNSDSEESTTSENSNKSENNFYLNLLFNNPINNNMATRLEMQEIFERVFGVDPRNPVQAQDTITGKLQAIQNATAGYVVNAQTFHGKENEDPTEWIRQLDAAYLASGRAEGNNGETKAAYAITLLRDSALDWYNGIKTTNANHLTQWTDANADENLKQRLIDRFTNLADQRRKIIELQNIKQNKGESVEDYTKRFKKILRIATRQNNLQEIFKVNFFIQGLEPEIQLQTRLDGPQNLQDAINRAKLVEETKNAVTQNMLGNKINQTAEEILVDQTNPYKNRQNPIFIEMNKDKTDKDMDELNKRFEKLEAHMVNLARRNVPRQRVTCDYCNKPGHTRQNCFLLNKKYKCYRCDQPGHSIKNCPLNMVRNQQVNYIDEDYFEDYEDLYYNDLYYEDENDLYYQDYDYNYDLYEAERMQKNALPRPYPRKKPPMTRSRANQNEQMFEQ